MIQDGELIWISSIFWLKVLIKLRDFKNDDSATYTTLMENIDTSYIHETLVCISDNYGFLGQKTIFSIAYACKLMINFRFEPDPIEINQYIEKRIGGHAFSKLFIKHEQEGNMDSLIFNLPASTAEVERSFN